MRAVPANSASEKGQKPNFLVLLLPPLQLQLSPILVVGVRVLVVGVAWWMYVVLEFGSRIAGGVESDSNKQSVHYQ